MRLAGLDFETANGRTGSICAAGCAILEDGAVTESREWLVCPHVGYRWMRPEYTRIHGLTYGDVRDCPEFCDIWPELRRMLQAAELLDCMERLKRHRIDTAFESNAAASEFPRMARCADLTIADLKAGTSEVFRNCTGGDLNAVLEHLAEAAAIAPALLIRVPVITGMNDDPEELARMAELPFAA